MADWLWWNFATNPQSARNTSFFFFFLQPDTDMHSTHNPRVEDYPVMPVETHMISLKPNDFFSFCKLNKNGLGAKLTQPQPQLSTSPRRRRSSTSPSSSMAVARAPLSRTTRRAAPRCRAGSRESKQFISKGILRASEDGNVVDDCKQYAAWFAVIGSGLGPDHGPVITYRMPERCTTEGMPSFAPRKED